jgi:S-adenosylmethionine decarboxylase
MEELHKPVGKHLIVEFFGCGFVKLNDLVSLKALAKKAGVATKSGVLEVVGHKFDPQGVSVVLLLSDSHLSIHTYPEFGYAAIDIFTCGDVADPYLAYIVLRDGLQPTNSNIDELKRGVI